jgi:hypothetical protein
MKETTAMWHLLQISGPLDCEFGAALAERVPLIGWEPSRVHWPNFSPGPSESSAQPLAQPSPDPRLEIRKVPLMRGFARWPFSALARTGSTVTRHLLAASPNPEEAVLLCTAPFFAPVAERWPGRVIYWLTDLIACYGYTSFAQVARLDRRLCRVASLVCPNSERIASYLRLSAHCDPAKICLLPNATRAANLLPAPSSGPAELPSDLADLPRPIAGIIGNLAANMDWLFIEKICAAMPHLSWALVGPTDMEIEDPLHREARRRVLRLPQVRSVGRKPYGDLVQYARAFDVAVIPYRRVEPTFSGSSTRFYEHLAAGRPILATRGFEELLHKQPLLTLVETPQEAVTALRALEECGFNDGFAPQRWLASQQGTWEERASTLIGALAHRDASPETSVARSLRESTVS